MAQNQEILLGFELTSGEVGIVISLWKNSAPIKKGRENTNHKIAQENGEAYKTRIAKVERDYEF